MVAAVDGLKQIAQYVRPRTLKTMREAGAVDPKGPIALAGILPWLLGRGPSLGIVSQMNAFVLKNKPAIHDRDGMVTWAEVDARANRAAHLLLKSGVEPDSKLGLLLRNGREMAELALGTQKIGVTACPFNTWAKTKELKTTIENAGIKALVYDTAHAEQVEKAAPSDLPLFFVGDESKAIEGSESYEEALAEQPTSPQFPFTRQRGNPRLIIHTSGTTGTPKGATRSAAAAGIGTLVDLMQVVPYRRDDIVVCPAPLFHSFGLATFVLSSALGTTMVLPEKFDAEGTLRLIQEHRATALSLVPVMIRRIVSLDDEIKKRYDLSSLRVVMASGSAISEDLRRAAMDLFGPVLYDLYGSTEVGWVTIAGPEDMKNKPKSVGKPVPGVDVVAFDEDGKKLPSGEVGELYIKSDFVFEGYTSGDTKKVIDGYMTIGDVGRVDDEGYLYIEGRADDMVVVGGENIYPIEIEGVIEDIEGVSEVAVFGVDDPEYGQVLAAFVVGSVETDLIKKTCESELASFKVPRRIEIVEELPRTSTGKVLKRELIADIDAGEA